MTIHFQARWFIGAILFMMLLSLPLAATVPGPLAWSAVSGAWALALANALLAFWINARAVGGDSAHFLTWGLGLNGFRICAVLAAVALLHAAELPGFSCFLLTLAVGYVVFLPVEIITLVLASTGSHAHG